MENSPPVPTDPPPALHWTDTESIEDKEAEGQKSLDSPSEGGTEGGPPEPGEANPFTLVRLKTSMENSKRLSLGKLEHVGQVLSEIAQYPLLPKVVKRVLGFEDGTVRLNRLQRPSLPPNSPLPSWTQMTLELLSGTSRL